jgi:putative transposase
MPRQPRHYEVGSLYHVFNRGTDRRKIFFSNQDYHRFILGLEFFNSHEPVKLWNLLVGLAGSDPAKLLGARLREERNKQNKDRLVDLCAFALMPNHYHLILKEIKQDGISEFMKKLGGYTTYFNKQNNRSGTLFQGRYKHVPLTSDSQLSIALTYVHTNPIELVEPLWKKYAKVENLNRALNQLNTYKFSSYHDYINNPTFPQTTSRDFFTAFFKERRYTIKTETESWIKHKAERAKQNGQWPNLA